MCIVAHIHNLHFTDFMDNGSVIALIEYRRQNKYRVHHLVEAIFTTHQVDQTLRIVEYRPGVMPAITFRKGVSPFQRVERRLEGAVFILATHQFVLGVIQILIVHRSLCEDFNLFFRLLQSFAKLVDTPVIISILQCAGCILVNADIIRHVTQLIIIFIPQTSGRTHFRMHSIRSVFHGFPQRLNIVSFQSFQVSVGNYGSGVVSNHTTSMTGARPFRQESAFLVGVH